MNKILIGITAACLLMGMSFAAYTNATYNQCFQNIFSLALCPLAVVAYLPFIVEFVAFLVVYRRMRPPSYALSMLSAAIMSYLFFILFLAFNAATPVIDLYLAVSIILTVCWIALFAYEINHA